MKKLLITMILPLSALADAGSYALATARSEVCVAVAGVALNVAVGRDKADMTWPEISASFSQVEEGAYKDILTSAAKEAYEGNPNTPPRALWRFTYSKCLDKMISAGY